MKNGAKTWQEILQANQPCYCEELVELLRIPSVSAARDSVGEVKRAADWVSRRLQQAGIEHVEVMPTGEQSRATVTARPILRSNAQPETPPREPY